MQIATIVPYIGDDRVRIPRPLSDVFVVVGGERVFFDPSEQENCIFVFFSREFEARTMKRLKVRVGDTPGSSSIVYKTIEEDCRIGILSVQGTTTGRKKSAVDDFLLDFSGRKLSKDVEVEVLLNIFKKSPDCKIERFSDHNLPSVISDQDQFKSAKIDETGEFLVFPPKFLDEWFKRLRESEGTSGGVHEVEDGRNRRVIVNFDTEFSFLTLTFTKPNEKIGKMILFQRADQPNTGRVAAILRDKNIDFLVVQTNMLGHALDIPMIDFSEDQKVLKWDVIADFSGALGEDQKANGVAQELARHEVYIYGGGIRIYGEDLISFGHINKDPQIFARFEKLFEFFSDEGEE